MFQKQQVVHFLKKSALPTIQENNNRHEVGFLFCEVRNNIGMGLASASTTLS